MVLLVYVCVFPLWSSTVMVTLKCYYIEINYENVPQILLNTKITPHWFALKFIFLNIYFQWTIAILRGRKARIARIFWTERCIFRIKFARRKLTEFCQKVRIVNSCHGIWARTQKQKWVFRSLLKKQQTRQEMVRKGVNTVRTIGR